MDMRWHRIRKKNCDRDAWPHAASIAARRNSQTAVDVARNEKKNRAGVEKILATPPRGTFACAESSNTSLTADDVDGANAKAMSSVSDGR
jgi:hypothetical protein